MRGLVSTYIPDRQLYALGPRATAARGACPNLKRCTRGATNCCLVSPRLKQRGLARGVREVARRPAQRESAAPAAPQLTLQANGA